MILSFTKKCRRGVVLVILVLNYVMVSGQLKLTGNISDSLGKPVAYAGLRLLNDSGRAIRSSFSDTLGRFHFSGLPAGKYSLAASFMDAKLSPVKIVLPVDSIVSLVINLSTPVLKEVIVNSSKPLLERKIDRLVFNLENSIAAKGTDLATAIGLTPMLRVDDNGISIIGKSGVAVMINERIVHLSGADLINYLKSLRADDVSKIEVITTPPSKYDAQGNSGLINIVLKKNPALGWSGSLSSSYIQNSVSSFADNFSLNYQSVKFSGSLRLRYSHRENVISEENNLRGTKSIISLFPRKTFFKAIGANISLDYKINKSASIGLIYDNGSTRSDIHLKDISTYQTNDHNDSTLITTSLNSNPVTTQTLNLYYDQKLGTSGKKLSTGFNYFSNEPTTHIDFQTVSDASASQQTVRTFSGIRYKIWSLQSDITLPYSGAIVETGVKFTNYDNNSDVRYYNLVQPDYIMDVTKSNRFDYNEKNIAGYISAQKDLSKKWSAKAGIRYEYSLTHGYSATTHSDNRSKYGRIFPTAYITYKLDNKNTFSLNYSKRINRPNIRLVNPFRYYTNAYTYFTGNPLLQPSYNHNIEFSWLYKSIFSINVYLQKLYNGYGSITEFNSPYRITNAKNYLTQNSAGLGANLNLRFFTWWENSSYFNYSISNSYSSVPEVLTKNGSAFTYGTSNTFAAAKNLNLFVNYFQSLPSTQGNIYRYNQFTLTSGVRFSLLQNKLQLNASFLRGSVEKVKGFQKDYIFDYEADYDYRTLNVGATWLFGKTKVRGNSKRIDFKETQRAN